MLPSNFQSLFASKLKTFSFRVTKDECLDLPPKVYVQRQVNLNKKFLVFFHGYFIPLQGVEYIIGAAKKLNKDKDIFFRIVGSGQTYKHSIELAQELSLVNVEFMERVEHEKLPELIREADVCLGIFGDTNKTQRVIPNKVYESIAMRKAVITSQTVAIKELFENRKNILMCKVANAGDLADKILELKNNKKLKESIAKGGYDLFQKKCRPKVIAKRLLYDLNISS